MSSHQFTATLDEIELAECLRRTTARRSTGTLSRDAAIRILKESNLSYRQIREIWTIADHGGNGKLSNDELCVIIRLAGWVQQRGLTVSESLLEIAGPLPVLKGVLYQPRSPEEHRSGQEPTFYLDTRQITSSTAELTQSPNTGAYCPDQMSRGSIHYPLITTAHMENTRRIFETTAPTCGLMDRETAVDILIQKLDAPFFLLEDILNLVRTSHRLSLNIIEFALAAYFVVQMNSGAIRSLPSFIPEYLYEQLWSPVLLSSSPLGRIDEKEAANNQASSVSSAHSSESNLLLKTPTYFSPVRRQQAPSFSEKCSSVVSIETRNTSKLWKRVAKHCEKVFKVPSLRSRRAKRRASVISSHNSTHGTIFTQSSESSFEALERDSFLFPARGERVSMDVTQLPLIYTSEGGLYFAPSRTVDDSIIFDDLTQHHSPDVEKTTAFDYAEDTETIESTGSFDEDTDGYQPEQAESVENVLLSRINNMQEEHTYLRLQMQIMQKSMQKLNWNSRPSNKNVHFAGGVEADLAVGDRVRDSIQVYAETSRMTQSLKNSKELGGPRDMLSSKGSSTFSSTLRRRPHYGKIYNSIIPQGPRDRRSGSSSMHSADSASSEMYFQKARYRPTISERSNYPLRSILKVKVDRSDTTQMMVDDEDFSSKSSPTRQRRQGKRLGMTNETLQAWNKRFIPVEAMLSTLQDKVPKQKRSLPRPPRKLPTPGRTRRQQRNLPSIPSASTSHFPGSFDDEYCSSVNSMSMRTSFGTMSESDATSSCASSPRSSSDFSSLFSRRRSARTTLLTEIDEYNDTVVNDLKEAAPELVLQVKKSLLRELRTKSTSIGQKQRFSLEGDSMQESQMAKALENAYAELRMKEEALKRFEDSQAEIFRQHSERIANMERRNDEMRCTIADQEERIWDLVETTTNTSIPLPAYAY